MIGLTYSTCGALLYTQVPNIEKYPPKGAGSIVPNPVIIASKSGNPNPIIIVEAKLAKKTYLNEFERLPSVTLFKKYVSVDSIQICPIVNMKPLIINKSGPPPFA